MSFIKKFYANFEKVTVPLGYIMGICGFVCLFKWGDKWKWIGFIIISLVTILIASGLVLVEIIQEKKNANIMPDENIVAKKLKDAMKAWYEDEQYGEVITFGKALGRALYISASYETRIEIGEIIKKAAEHLNDDLLLTNILLDDLGWTKFLCGRVDATDDIKKGIDLATKNNFYKEISKGYRHLMAIELSVWNHPQKAHDLLDKAYDAYNCMDEGRTKEITLSGLLFASSELAFKEKQYDLAMQKAKESENKRRALHELDRHMRYYAQIGKIELFKPNGDIREARNYFLKGIEESESVNRIDEIVKNAYGYAICSFKLGERKKAQKRTGEIIKKYGNIPLYSEDALLRDEYQKLIVEIQNV